MLIRKVWQISDSPDPSGSLPERVMANRGLLLPKERQAFMQMALTDLHDPFLLPDMAAACSTITMALADHRRIIVHGDYDVDGLTATALLVRFLRRLGADCDYLVPDRLLDGYGLSSTSVARAQARQAGLLITVDCGIASCAEVDALQGSGIPVIITDHHECGPCLPAARAVINPRRPDSGYPFASLAGVGVTLKLIQALCQNLELGDVWQEGLSLVAMGTVADVVPLLDENRVLVHHGLAAIAAGRQIGLSALLAANNQDGRRIDANTLGYILAPRLNAAGRLGDVCPALDLLLTDDPVVAAQCAAALNEQNRQRQALEAEITATAMQIIDETFDFTGTDLIVLAREGWHPGVIGIVCSRLVDQYNRPVIILAGDGESFRGSARTCGTFDILAAIRAAAPWTLKFGGHRKAAGVEVAASQLAGFTAAINAYAAQVVCPEDWLPVLTADTLAEPQELTVTNAQALERLAPFGEGNRQPLLVCRGLGLADWRLVGNGRHVKLKVSLPDGRILDGIAFNLSGADDLFMIGETIDVLFALEVSTWQGRQSLQLHIRDLQPGQSGNEFLDAPWLADQDYRRTASIQPLAARYQMPLTAFMPSREEYVAVYQFLRAHYAQRPVITDLTLLARRVSRSYQISLNMFRLARILAVFQETALISLQLLGKDRIRLALQPTDRRVRLEEAPTYRHLQAQGGAS